MLSFRYLFSLRLAAITAFVLSMMGSVLVVNDELRLLQEPEGHIPSFVCLELVDLFPALDVDIEGVEGKIVDGRIKGGQFLVHPLLLQDLVPEFLPHDLLEQEDERDGLRGREVLDRADPDDAVEKGLDTVRGSFL